MGARWSGASPAETGGAASSSSSFCIGPRLARADRAGLLGDVDPDGAPRDATPAAHAARAAELVDPGGELVGHPLPVAGARGRAHGAAVDVGVVDGEADR